MATIVLNWELGADLGHINRLLPIALQLRETGHQPVMVLRDISRAESILGKHQLTFLQAPIWLTPVHGLPADINFTETLYRFGYLHPDGLLSMTKAWRALWALLNPDLMIFDHAPTALLAARGLPIPRMIIGNSFGVPPAERPLPRFRWWTNGMREQPRLEETEQRATRNSNTVLRQLNAPPINQLSDLFQAEALHICGRPQLDVYGPRHHEAYIGPINTTTIGAAPRWPLAEGPAVFAYIKPHYQHFEALLKTIGNSKARYLIFAPGMPEALVRRFQKGHIQFSTTPLRMDEVIKQCHSVICHAGGMTDIALDAGKPLLLLPTQMEQTMTSHRAAALGAALFLPPEGNPGLLPKLLKQLLDDSALGVCATQYAATLPHTAPSQAVAQVVTSCEKLLAIATAANHR